jgi:hypothetical protein
MRERSIRYVTTNARTPGVLLRRWPRALAVVTWAVSLLAMAAAALLPMLGTHPLVIVALAAWLVTFGLPTTVAFVVALVLWRGDLALPGMSGEAAFAAVASAGALVLHLLAYRFAARASCS